MIKLNAKHYENNQSDSDHSDLSSNSDRYEEEFETFAAKKKDPYAYNPDSSREQDDSSQNQSEGSQRNKAQQSDEEEKQQNDESIDIIEARIKKLESQLSKKLKKLSPERQIQRPQYDEIKKENLKSKYQEELQSKTAKEDFKKESISPKHKKAKTKQIQQPIPYQNKQPSKRINETYQLKTIEEPKPSKTNNRKLTQSHQGTFKQQESKRQNEQKNKVSSKSIKKRSCVEKEIQDMDYLKSKIGGTEMTKLEKQIELLKILESIKGKLKRSINHKLNKLYPDDRSSNKSKVTAFLLQRGCPANYLS